MTAPLQSTQNDLVALFANYDLEDDETLLIHENVELNPIPPEAIQEMMETLACDMEPTAVAQQIKQLYVTGTTPDVKVRGFQGRPALPSEITEAYHLQKMAEDVDEKFNPEAIPLKEEISLLNELSNANAPG